MEKPITHEFELKLLVNMIKARVQELVGDSHVSSWMHQKTVYMVECTWNNGIDEYEMLMFLRKTKVAYIFKTSISKVIGYTVYKGYSGINEVFKMFNELLSLTVDLINTRKDNESLQKQLDILVNDFERHWEMIRLEQGIDLIPPECCSDVKD